MTTDFEVGNYHRKRGQGELRLSRLKWKDKIYAKNCVLKFRKSAARLYFFQWNHKENTLTNLIADSTWSHGPK